ncbi:sensor histidine kinase [Cohnella endophytica]|uniref:histidine kinase n=1 Tax=Cohnella endophytica TaxID=2419778 RepID=A0A494XKX5_9BACL|nr:sensor histidine kinase [Cohnella endophytica]RKP51357.1 sensor histidine kinase [Cohnella endophytica]
MRSILRWNLTINRKILIGFLAVICICVAAITTIAYEQISRIVENKISLYNQQVVNKSLDNVEFYLQDVAELAKNISVDDQILDDIHTIKANEQDSKTRQLLDNAVKKYQFLKSYITDISLFEENDRIVYSFDYDYKNVFFQDEWYKSYEQSSGDSYFSSIHTSIIRGTSLEGIETLTYIKKAYDLADPTQYLFTVAIEMDAKILNNALRQLDSSDDWGTVVYNSNRQIMLQQTELYPQIDVAKLLPSVTDNDFRHDSIRLQGQRYLVLKSSMSKYDWQLISFAPYDKIMWEVSSLRYYLIIAGIICILLAAVISIFISKGITVPLAKLMNVIREMEKGNFKVQADIRSGDEIERLNGVLIRMSNGMENLIERNIQEEKLKRKAELTALQAQINPHFLYNTLESMNWFAVRKKEMEISDVLTNLGKFFRISLSNGSPFIPLHQEIEHIRSYLNIQKFRYSNRFESEIEVAPEALNYYIPKLILQPIVENSLLHAFKDQGGKGSVRISVAEQGNDIAIVVADDGCGLNEEQQSKLRESLSGSKTNDPAKGYGLRNVHDRIQLSFGVLYGLSFESTLGEGTVIRLLLPQVEQPPLELT